VQSRTPPSSASAPGSRAPGLPRSSKLTKAVSAGRRSCDDVRRAIRRRRVPAGRSRVEMGKACAFMSVHTIASLRVHHPRAARGRSGPRARCRGASPPPLAPAWPEGLQERHAGGWPVLVAAEVHRSAHSPEHEVSHGAHGPGGRVAEGVTLVWMRVGCAATRSATRRAAGCRGGTTRARSRASGDAPRTRGAVGCSSASS